jgi:hypothetical protein
MYLADFLKSGAGAEDELYLRPFFNQVAGKQ